MFQPSTSRDPLLTRGDDSDSDDIRNVGKLRDFTDVDDGQSMRPISESTVVEGVEAAVLKLPEENQKFLFVEFSPDWSLVVTLTSVGTLSVWDAKDEWVLVASKRLHHDGRILKCIVLDPYVKGAVLLCFDSGEIFRTNVRGPATSDDPGSSQDRGVFHMELVYKCEGRSDSRFDHFKFSLDRKTMVHYNHDGEFAAVQFKEEGGLKKITLSKEFKLKQESVIYISEQSILISAILQSSKDLEHVNEQVRTLVWPKVNFENIENMNKPLILRGKGYLSNDRKYVLVSILAIEHESRCCQIRVHLIDDIKSSTNMKCSLFATRILGFTSNHPHLECLDRSQFKSLHVDDESIKPLIAIHQTDSIGSKLLFWDTESDALIYEIDLTRNKGGQTFNEIKHCWSSDSKWLGVCSIGAQMLGLVCARSGVFVWTAHVPQIRRENMRFCTLKFDRSGTRLMIFLSNMIYLLEPSCLSKKPQKHPMRHNLRLSQASKNYSGFEVLEMAKKWPKQLLFNVLVAGQSTKLECQHFLLDVAISETSKRLVMICKKYEGHCFLSVIDYSEKSSWRSLWLVAMTRWNQCFISNDTSPLVKEIMGEQRERGISVFYYDNDEKSIEQIILLSSKDGIEVQDFGPDLRQLSEWIRISQDGCFSFMQSKDRRSVVSLADRLVLIIDLNEKRVIKSVEYSFSLSQWWESILDDVEFFGYSHCYSFASQECEKEHKLFLQDRFRGLLDISNDGEKILIGWDNERNKSLVITPDKSEEQFRIDWDEARDSLCHCSMLTENGKWLGFIDHEKLKGGDIVVCIVDTSSNRQQRIWLGLNKLVSQPCLESKPCSESQPFIANFFLRINKEEKQLMALGIEDIGATNRLKQFVIQLVRDIEHVHHHESLLEEMIQPTNLNKYGETSQPSTFNMRVDGMSNFQRVLMEDGGDMVEKFAKCALENKVKISDVYHSCRNEEHHCATLLENALKKQEDALVQLWLKFIENGLFTFHSSSAMVKACFFDVLFSHSELFMQTLKKDCLTLQVSEVKVNAKLFQSHRVVSNVVFTSDTMLEPGEYFAKMAIEDFQKTENIRHLGFTKDYKEGKKVLACVSFYYISNACKVGLNGVIRKLLMHDVDPSIFKTKLVRAIINWKWESLWKRRCLHELRLYVLFLVLFTSYAICLGVLGDRLVHNRWIGLCISLLLGGVFVLAIRFSFDEYKQLKTYIKDGKEVFGTHVWGVKHYFWNSKWNLVDICSYFLVLVLIPIFHLLYIFGNCSKEPLFAMVAIESLLAWFKLWYYAQPFEQTSALVLLIRNVVHDCRPFLGLAFVILVGFSVALFVLFQCCLKPISMNVAREGDDDDDDDDDDDEGELIHESFGSVRRSLSTLFYAMVGTFEPEVYYNHQPLSWLTTFVFILYMALEMIVMLNMLIAIMGDTFDRVKSEEDIQIIVGRASFIDACEASLRTQQIREIEKQIGKFLYVLTPKDSIYMPKKTSWIGKIPYIKENINKAIEENNEEMGNNIKKRFHQMELALQKTLEEQSKMLKEYKKALDKHTKQEEEHREQEEEHWKKDQALLHSIAKRIDALEVESNKLASSLGHQTT